MTDDGSPVGSDHNIITINLTDANDAPNSTGGSVDLPENSPNGTAVTTATGTDPDAGQTLSFSITGGNTDGAFAIDATSGAITVANSAVLDFETTPDWDLAVRVTDNGSPSLFDTENVHVDLTNVNEAPSIATTSGSLAYLEGDGLLQIDDGLTVVDVDSPNLMGSSVAITGSCAPGEDVLALVSPAVAAITPSYNSATCTLTLSGSASVADYQAALRNVGYTNSSDSPSADPRTVTFTVDDGDLMDSATRGIAITVVPDPPSITAGGPFTYTEDDGATVIGSGISAADPDGTLVEATIQVTTGCVDGEDFLEVTALSGLLTVEPYDEATCTLTISGTAADSVYEPTLQAVTYRTTSQNPATTRVVTFTVDDGASTGSDTVDITITPVNDAPTVAANSASITYTENGPALTVDSGLALGDVDGTVMTAASIQITVGCADPEDELAIDAGDVPAGITVVAYVEGTCILQLTGSASLADYQAALRAVTYLNASDNPSVTTRTVRFDVSDDEPISGFDTRDIEITAENDSPVVTTTAGDLAYTENDPATAIDGLVDIDDFDSANMTGAAVSLSTGCQPDEDVLALPSPPGGITTGWVPATCVLNLFGTASRADYEAALRAVTYENTSEDPATTPRVASFFVNDGLDFASDDRGITVTSVNDAPTLADKAHDVTGNIGISVAAGGGVLVGVTDAEGDLFTAGVDGTSAHFGDVAIATDGGYTFNPEAGRQGADVVTFEVCDDAPVPACASASLTLTVSGMIWFVDSLADPGGDGRIGSPFEIAVGPRGDQRRCGRGDLPARRQRHDLPLRNRRRHTVAEPRG